MQIFFFKTIVLKWYCILRNLGADCVLLTTVQQLSSTTPSPNVSTSVVQSKPPTKPVTVITSQEKATTEIKASVTNEEYNEYLKIAEQNNWPQDEGMLKKNKI